ncbi:homogentisate 1,2-dioxygenase [Geopyxis carbonaria]|nr:homogentisate 1,2-dioxygenase [Geopyxis carbonaria]
MASKTESSVFTAEDPYTYLSGFPSHHSTEALPDALPLGRNSPQKPAYGLYAEKLSGSAFTAPRHTNRQSWLYRILPSASHTPFTALLASERTVHPRPAQFRHLPNQLRWSPFDHDPEADFISGLHMIAGAGDVSLKEGLGIYIYACGRSMAPNAAFYNTDGDLLIVPQTGSLDIRTELGRLFVRPHEIAVVPRGVRFHVALPAGEKARGYILETFSQGHFELPELGPIGSNGLANPRDFQVPVASFEDVAARPVWEPFRITTKCDGSLFEATQPHSPWDVVAWHGNYYPYKYNLALFNTIGSISYDHPDPSIFTVLTCPSPVSGTAVADFVIFPPRWLVGEDTFRPPWYHRNTMSEFMGLIAGDYDAKEGGGFEPGGASLHNVMSAHGPDATTAETASEAEQPPMKVGAGSMAFMFESVYCVGVTEWGRVGCGKVQEAYNQHSWTGVRRRFVMPKGS